MNKTIKFMSLAVAAMGMAACSSEDVLEGNNAGLPHWSGEGDGFVKINLSLPSNKDGRFAVKKNGKNDEFAKGDEAEYEVKDVAIILFKGQTEGDATFQQAFNLADTDFGAGHEGNVTVDKQYVQQINAMSFDENEKIYALAVVNRNSVFTITNGGSLTINGTPISSSTKFSDIQQMIAKTNRLADEFHTTGFLMLNAPLWTKPGMEQANNPADGAMQILADVSSSIYPTKQAATEGEAASIYVERAVAKVTVQAANDTDNGHFTWSLKHWGLDNTNGSSYIVRNVSNYNNELVQLHTNKTGYLYRMVGSKTVKHDKVSEGTNGATDLYRTYFCVDPNYSTPGAPEDFNLFPGELNGDFTTSTQSYPRYCAENTFDVNNQIWGQTTRVLVRAVLTHKDGETFYASAGDESFKRAEDIKIEAYNYALGQYKDQEVYKKLAGWNVLTGSPAYSADNITIAENADNITAKIDVSDLKLIEFADDDAVNTATSGEYTTKDAIKTAFESLVTEYSVNAAKLGYKYYNGGVSYYQARIKHFGDDDAYTPWNNGEYAEGYEPRPNTVSTIYKGATQTVIDGNYLGRYGMVRNNWYDLNIKSVSKIGHSTLDELKLDGNTTPDDVIEEEQWINVEVNILSWAKRTQNVEL